MKKVNLFQLQDLALNLARDIKLQDVIALSGELGSGKTTFAKYLINAFLATEVSSPTFNLLNLYHTAEFTIWHFDLYRLNSVKQVYDLGIEDALNMGVTIVEWPEIAQSILPENTIKITLKYAEEDNMRLIRMN